MKLVTYNGQQADFYILNKGLNAGKPSRTPFRNSFAVFSDNEFLFQKVQVLFIGRCFEPFIHGSVIPTIRIKEVKDVILENPINLDDKAKERLKSLDEIDKFILLSQQKIKLFKEMKIAIARETIRR